MTLEEFEQEVNRHDLTYSYSDDHGAWQRGSAHYNKIRKAAENLPRADVERIWNAKVDSYLVESARAPFYWQWTGEATNRCPKCGDLPTYQTPDGTYWDGNAHFWRIDAQLHDRAAGVGK